MVGYTRYRRRIPDSGSSLLWKIKASLGAILTFLLATWIGKLIVALLVTVLVIKLVATIWGLAVVAFIIWVLARKK